MFCLLWFLLVNSPRIQKTREVMLWDFSWIRERCSFELIKVVTFIWFCTNCFAYYFISLPTYIPISLNCICIVSESDWYVNIQSITRAWFPTCLFKNEHAIDSRKISEWYPLFVCFCLWAGKSPFSRHLSHIIRTTSNHIWERNNPKSQQNNTLKTELLWILY